MTPEEKEHILEYSNYNKSQRIDYWERFFYWDFKGSYRKELIDHFDYPRLQHMKKMDSNFDEIQEEVIQNFVKLISGGSDEETLNELKEKLKLNGKT